MKTLIIFFLSGSILSAQKFASIGDYGEAGSDELAVANLVKSWNPDFIITLGDNNYPDGDWTTIDENIGQHYHEFIFPYIGSYGQGSDSIRFFPSLGNHDWKTTGAQPYLDYFELPNNERYYDYIWENVHFFAIDSDTAEPDGYEVNSIQAAWLQNQLSLSTSNWNFVYFHHSPYSSGQHGSTQYMQWPFKEWGADVVMAAHDHTYERIIYEEFPYFVNGLGGKSRYAFEDTVQGSTVRYNEKYGAMLMEANAEQISFKFYNVDSELIDDYVWAKGVPIAPSDLVTVINPNPLSVELNWVDNSNQEDGFIIERRALNLLRFEVIDTVSSNTITYLDTTTTVANYNYRVCAFNGYGCSAYSNVAQVTIPVELISFTAKASNKSVILDWITATETNNMGFEIQKKINENWTELSYIEGQGNSTIPHNYHFTDEEPFVGRTNIYRLKQIDFNGSFCYTQSVEVYVPIEEYALEQNYPNPFNAGTIIRYKLAADGNVYLKLFNVFGEEIRIMQNEFKSAGNYVFDFNTEGLASGVYIYRLNVHDYSEAKKMILLR